MVEKALRQLTSQQAFATTDLKLWLTMADFERYVVDLAATLLKQRKLKGCWFLREAGIRKS